MRITKYKRNAINLIATGFYRRFNIVNERQKFRHTGLVSIWNQSNEMSLKNFLLLLILTLKSFPKITFILML